MSLLPMLFAALGYYLLVMAVLLVVMVAAIKLSPKLSGRRRSVTDPNDLRLRGHSGSSSTTLPVNPPPPPAVRLTQKRPRTESERRTGYSRSPKSGQTPESDSINWPLTPPILGPGVTPAEIDQIVLAWGKKLIRTAALTGPVVVETWICPKCKGADLWAVTWPYPETYPCMYCGHPHASQHKLYLEANEKNVTES